MLRYQTILIAIDVYEDFEAVIERGIQVGGSASSCHLLYVTYPQSSAEPYGLFLERDYSEDVRQQARRALQQAAKKYAIPENQLHVGMATPADGIRRMADDLHADLIVIGSHGQAGVQLLLGSTANAVLHGVKTDVLAVRLGR